MILKDQTEEIIESLKVSKITEADMSGCNLTSSTFDSLGLNQSLTTLNLRNVTFCADHTNHIFINISLVRNISVLNMSNSTITSTEPLLLSDAVSRIFHVNLSFCSLRS